MSRLLRDPNFQLAACNHCGQHIEFPREGAGSRTACPVCGGETIRDPLPEITEEPEDISAAELQHAFTGPVSVPGISVFYQFGLLLVALFMVVLPAVYFALATALGWGVYWYATHGLAIFSVRGGGVYGALLKVVLYVGPLIGGFVAVFFMFKPFMARSPRRAAPVELNPAEHPRVYQFIAHISDCLRTPMPTSIQLSSELGASAGLRRGWGSFFSNDLALNLGLPLIAGFNTRQLASVVAHELGHCRQALAMRLYYVIGSVNHWFARVVYQRDVWDEALEEWGNEAESGWVTVIYLCATCSVGLSRLFLKLFMYLGWAANCFLSRQMEYHADSCSFAVAGSAAAESAFLRSRELSLIYSVAAQRMRFFWERRRQLPDSIPQLLAALETTAAPDFAEKSRDTLMNETAGVFATHPTAAQRIRKARARGDAGAFTLEKPAASLFTDFESLAKGVTAQYYLTELRIPVMPAMLKPVEEFVKVQS